MQAISALLLAMPHRKQLTFWLSCGIQPTFTGKLLQIKSLHQKFDHLQERMQISLLVLDFFVVPGNKTDQTICTNPKVEQDTTFRPLYGDLSNTKTFFSSMNIFTYKYHCRLWLLVSHYHHYNCFTA